MNDADTPAVKLLEEGLHLRMYGERAPGGDETWAEWDRKVETYLRSLPPLGAVVTPTPQDDSRPALPHEVVASHEYKCREHCLRPELHAAHEYVIEDVPYHCDGSEIRVPVTPTPEAATEATCGWPECRVPDVCVSSVCERVPLSRPVTPSELQRATEQQQ